MCKDEVDGNPYTILMYMYIYLYVMILIHVLQMYMYKTPFHVYAVINSISHLNYVAAKFQGYSVHGGKSPVFLPCMYIYMYNVYFKDTFRY